MNIYYKNEKLEIEPNKTILDIFNKEIKKSKKIIIAAKCNNYMVSLNHIIEINDKIELVDITSEDGMRVYRRGLLYVLGKAFEQCYEKAWITVNFQLSNALFCEVEREKVTEKMIEKVNNKMKEIVEQDLKLVKKQMTKKEAEEFYNENETNKGKLQLYAPEKEFVSLYYCEDYYNYFYGTLPISTGYMKIFELIKYKDGFLIRYPSKDNPTKLPIYEDNSKLLHTLEHYDDIHKDLNVNTINKLNRVIKDDEIREIILIDEALHEKRIAQIADEILSKKGVKIILIAGPSSSGKTTFAKRLGIQLKVNGFKPRYISVDNYFVEREENPKDKNGEYNFECIEAIDLNLFNEHLLKLIDGQEVDMPIFNFKTGHKEYKNKKLKVGEDEILVIEGIHCLNDKLTKQIPKEQKYKIYISNLTVLNIDYFNRISTTDSRLIRRIVRDNQFRGYSALHTLKMWDSVNRGERKYIFPYQEQADSMFNSSLIYELGVLKDFAIPLLKDISAKEPQYSEAMRLYDFLRYFESVPTTDIPKNSLLREFIGEGFFEH